MEVHKRTHRTIRLIIPLLAVCLAIAALFWSRSLSPQWVGTKVPLPEGAFALDRGSGGCYCLAGNGLAAVTTGGWQLFDEKGALLASGDVLMDQPACAASEKLSVFYDMGDTVLLAVYPDGTVKTLETEGPIRFADVNGKGCLAVLTDKDGYKGSVTVYGRDLSPVFRWDAGSAWPVCARLSEDGRLAVACVTEEGSSFYLFRTDRVEPLMKHSAEKEQILDLAFVGKDTVAILTDTALLLRSTKDGAIVSEPFDGRYPAAFEAEEDLAVFATTPERFGGKARLVSLSGDGRTLGTLDTGREVLSLSVRDKHILLLCPGELMVYSRSLEKLFSLSVDENTQNIFLRPDGTALLLGVTGAELIDFGR